jgi:hypothetical protein
MPDVGFLMMDVEHHTNRQGFRIVPEINNLVKHERKRAIS